MKSILLLIPLVFLVACQTTVEVIPFHDQLTYLEPPYEYGVVYTFYDSGFADTEPKIDERVGYRVPEDPVDSFYMPMEVVKDKIWDKDLQPAKSVNEASCYIMKTPAEMNVACFQNKQIVYYAHAPFKGHHRSVFETWRLDAFPEIPIGDCKPEHITCPFE